MEISGGIPNQGSAPDGGFRCSVVICDDHHDLRRAVADVLSADSRFYVIAEATDARTCLIALQLTEPDVLLLDYNMPGGGPGLVRAVRELRPGTYILVFSGSTSAEQEMLAAGADAYLAKTGRLGPLLAALDLARAASSARPARHLGLLRSPVAPT
jgi:two-component system nitrate/nitrite response regulator NarL